MVNLKDIRNLIKNYNSIVKQIKKEYTQKLKQLKAQEAKDKARTRLLKLSKEYNKLKKTDPTIKWNDYLSNTKRPIIINRVKKQILRNRVKAPLIKTVFKNVDTLKAYEFPIEKSYKVTTYNNWVDDLIYMLVHIYLRIVKENGNNIYCSFYLKGQNQTREQEKNKIVSEWKTLKIKDIKDVKDLVEKAKAEYKKKLQEYSFLIKYVNVLLFKNSTAGGCNPENSKYTSEKITIDGANIQISYIDCKSKNNNCLFSCINRALNIKGNATKPDVIREKLGIEKGTKININDIKKITDYYKCGFILSNESNKIIASNDLNNDDVVNLKLINENYLLIDNYKYYYDCKKCGKKQYYNNINDHKCNDNVLKYYSSKIKKLKNVVLSKKKTENKKIDYENDVIYYDLETFVLKNEIETEKEIYDKSYCDKNPHEPYACGWYNQKYNVEYGKNCISKYIDDILNINNKTICAYYGSGFDNYFLMKELLKRNITIDNFILSNGRIIMLEFNNNKVFDLYLFTMSSLDKACKDFKIINAKSSFEHKLIKSWEDTEKYKDVVLPYLKLDVLALKELFQKINDMVYELEEVNITEYVTLSHLAYESWRKTINKKFVEIPNDIDKYNFIKQGTFGGRCYPQQQYYFNKYYEELTKNYKYNVIFDSFEQYINAFNITYNEIKQSNDYYFNADVTSLYPASMVGFLLCKVAYPLGLSDWSIEPEKEYNAGKIGFYEIEYEPPKNIRIPILPRKKYDKNINIGVLWSLENGVGIYTSVDIENAINAGYKVKFINKCLIWQEKTKDIYDDKGEFMYNEMFGEYINKWFKVKNEGKNENNKVKESIGKLMQNGLYGKTLQCAIFKKHKIVNTIDEFIKFKLEYDIDEYYILGDNTILLNGEIKNNLKSSCITKPSQLGAFVTAYSRKIMLTYMKAIDPTLQSMIFTYTDTDSIRIHANDHKKLVDLGYIKSKNDSQLGFLCSDIDNEGLILYENNKAPKNYKYDYINNKNDIYCGNNCTMKCKGAPRKELKNEYYNDNNSHDIYFDGLKKKNIKLSKNDADDGMNYFSILNIHNKRTFNKSDFKNMNKIDNQFYPFGYSKKCKAEGSTVWDDTQ